MLTISTLISVASMPSTRGWTTMIAPGVEMPWVSLGTCCGSNPGVGVHPWLAASSALGQPVAGIDTAFDYNDQGVIATVLAAASTPRAQVFLTTKIPGAAALNGDPRIGCPSLDYRACAVRAVRADLAMLKMAAADLVLLHDPGLANGTAVTATLWRGMQDAVALGLARSVGVSNFNAMQACSWRMRGVCTACAWRGHSVCTALARLVRSMCMANLTRRKLNEPVAYTHCGPTHCGPTHCGPTHCGPTHYGCTKSYLLWLYSLWQLDELVAQPTTNILPAVNQISMGVGGGRPEATLAACARHRVTAQAYWALKDCPYSDPVLRAVATAHGPRVSTAMVCVAWVLGRGVLLAAGTGANTSTVAAHTREDLGATTLVLSADEMARVGEAGERAAARAAAASARVVRKPIESQAAS